MSFQNKKWRGTFPNPVFSRSVQYVVSNRGKFLNSSGEGRGCNTIIFKVAIFYIFGCPEHLEAIIIEDCFYRDDVGTETFGMRYHTTDCTFTYENYLKPTHATLKVPFWNVLRSEK